MLSPWSPPLSRTAFERVVAPSTRRRRGRVEQHQHCPHCLITYSAPHNMDILSDEIESVLFVAREALGAAPRALPLLPLPR